ncbi:MAG: EAL domain-containing protein [Magnetococcales bacterium]|nr:EAL domain-containing protein [Magnetococcales bacterium]NGZ06639.1 EAL domain-containing protein [Magnetococcales bacterium]
MTMIDPTGIKRLPDTQAYARQEARLLKILLENSEDGVLLMDHRGIIRKSNEAFTLLTGYAGREVQGRHVNRFLNDPAARDQLQVIHDALWHRGYWLGNVTIPMKRGGVVPFSIKVMAVLPEQGSVRLLVVQVARQGRSARLAEQALEPEANWDPLTGLPTLALFKDRLRQTLSQAARRKFAVGLIFMDLDNFTLVNDSLGREKGDEALREVAHRLAKCLRTSDSVARIGADEFALLLADIDDVSSAVRNVGVVARKLYELLEAPIDVDGTEIRLSAAMGITISPQDGQDPALLMKNSATALSHAKRKGRNNYQFFSQEMTETARRRFAIENSLRYAVDRGQLLLYYQPQVDLKSGRVVGAEALVRWNHPERGLVSPMEFIPVAEETGLILPIGEWVLRTACRQLASWGEMGLPMIRVGVNLSALQFQRQDLVKIVQSCLEETGIDPSCLDLEITESAIMEDVQKTVEVLNRISALGVKLSIDDFGTGYSSLSQLRHFPFKTLKIDRSFVRSIENNAGDAAIVSAIIAMAHSLDQTVIVEGLETTAQLDIMRRLHCNEMQGYLFSAPTSAEEFTALLRRGATLPTKEEE